MGSMVGLSTPLTMLSVACLPWMRAYGCLLPPETLMGDPRGMVVGHRHMLVSWNRLLGEEENRFMGPS